MSKTAKVQKQFNEISINPKDNNDNFILYFQNTKVIGFVLMALAFLLYANTLTHGFVLDDFMVIKTNSFTKEGFSGLWDILTKDSFYGYFDAMKEDPKALLVSGGRYRPLSLMSFAIVYQFFGENAFVFHLFTILLFSCTVFILYKTLILLFNQKYDLSKSGLLSFLACLLFVVHPLHTEAVANIKGCDEIMALLGSLATLYFALKTWDTGNMKWLGLTSFCFFLACMAKENAVTFLAIIPLSIFVFRNEPHKGIGYSKITLSLLGAFVLFFILRGNALHWQFGNTAPNELLNNPFIKLVNGQWQPFSASEKLGTIMVTLIKYIGLLFIPYPLTHDYYPRAIETVNLGNGVALLSLIFYGFLLFYGIRLIIKKEIIGYAILFFLITLSIVSNIFFPVGTLMNERFLFMPSVGFSILMAALITKFYTFQNKNLLFALLSVVCIAYSFKTISRNRDWVSNEKLFLEDVKISTRSAKAHDDAGGVLFNNAKKITDEKEKALVFDEAISHFDKAIAIKPVFRHAHMHRAASYYLKGDLDKAISEYRRADEYWKDDQKVKDALALSLREKGFVIGKDPSKFLETQTYLNEAIKLNNSDAKANWFLAVSFAKQGQIKEALPWFEKAASLDPKNASYIYDLGSTYFRLGDNIRGNENYAKAKLLQPNIEDTRKNKQTKSN